MEKTAGKVTLLGGRPGWVVVAPRMRKAHYIKDSSTAWGTSTRILKNTNEKLPFRGRKNSPEL